MNDSYSELEKVLPPVFSRVVAAQLLGGLMSVGRLANLDSLGQGPQGRISLGRKVGYERSAFIVWLRSRGGEASAKPKIQPKAKG